jgi:tRNA (adenine37-N6)-methyltransferase
MILAMSSPSSAQSFRLDIPVAVLCVAAACSTILMIIVNDKKRYKRQLDDLQNEWSQKRQEERRGRIRAEIALRSALKQQQEERRHHRLLPDDSNATNEPSDGNCTLIFPLKRIGTVVSPYTKRMGTPRQPGLVPASRGRIDLDDGIAATLLDGIEEYSHIWVIFQFHANTDTQLSQKTKIRPPRANGIKVGQLSTRSPHRPNPLGLSMVKLEQRKARCLYISGLDLVHSTPVYDIKPVVPWDMVPVGLLRVPDWVSTTSDELPHVTFTTAALHQLHSAIDAKLFGGGDLYCAANDGFEAARETIRQILQQDPRSSHRGLKENGRGSRVIGNANYHLTLGNTKVTFRVGEDSVVQVLEIAKQEFLQEQYVDGIPLLAEGLTLS